MKNSQKIILLFVLLALPVLGFWLQRQSMDMMSGRPRIYHGGWRYQGLLKSWRQEGRQVSHFPARIPPEAKDIEIYTVDAHFRNLPVEALEFRLPADRISRLREEFEKRRVLSNPQYADGLVRSIPIIRDEGDLEIFLWNADGVINTYGTAIDVKSSKVFYWSCGIILN